MKPATKIKSSTKRLLWIFAATLLVVTGIAMYAFIISTNAALSLAEGFQFRRMQVTRAGDEHLFRFFVATNRVIADVDAPLAERMSNTRSARIHYLHLVNPGVPPNRLRYPFVTPAGRTCSVLTRSR